MKFLIGNTFPMGLIRRPVRIEPRPLDELRERLRDITQWRSFWGHTNTLATANRIAGVDLTPTEERPALRLGQDRYMVYDNTEYRECWILSPDYVPGFRPQPGVPPALEDITGWQILRMIWE